MFEHVFAPIKIREMELKNRIILPAMGTRMADADGFVTEKLVAYHAARAKGGCGLNIVEVAAVHTPSAPAHFVSISEDHLIEGHKKLTDAIHENGGKAGIQLWQGSIAVSMDPKCTGFGCFRYEFWTIYDQSDYKGTDPGSHCMLWKGGSQSCGGRI